MKKTAIITGSTSSLGQELSKIFANNKYKLILFYNSSLDIKNKLHKTLTSLTKEKDIIWIKSDFADKLNLKKEIKDIYPFLKENIAVLINNAGEAINKPIISIKDEDFLRVLDINFTASKTLSQLILKNMVKNKNGHIINISSIQGIQGGTFTSPYASTKAALIGLSQSIAMEYGKYNIKCNIVLPGYMDSKMTLTNSEFFKKQVIKKNALKRISDPKEIASFIYFLTTTNNISGQIFNLDSRILKTF